MRNTIVGLLAGIILASVAFQVLDQESAPPFTTDQATGDIPPADLTALDEHSTDASVVDEEGPRDDQTYPEDAPIQAAQQEAAQEPDPTIARTPIFAEVELPIYVDPLIQRRLENQALAGLRELHEELERQPIDSWSYTMESQLTTFFSQHPEFELGTPLIACRTTMCEIQIVAVGDQLGDNWIRAFRMLQLEEPWAADITRQQLAGMWEAVTAGTTTMLMFLERNEQNSEAQSDEGAQ